MGGIARRYNTHTLSHVLLAETYNVMESGPPQHYKQDRNTIVKYGGIHQALVITYTFLLFMTRSMAWSMSIIPLDSHTSSIEPA